MSEVWGPLPGAGFGKTPVPSTTVFDAFSRVDAPDLEQRLPWRTKGAGVGASKVYVFVEGRQSCKVGVIGYPGFSA